MSNRRPLGTNPKDRFAHRKVALGLLPGAAKIHGALAFADGAKKYGPYNWRKNKVLMTVYLDAAERHLLALRDGENLAPDSRVHHAGHAIACLAIILDASETGNLIDDRPLDGCVSRILARETIHEPKKKRKRVMRKPVTTRRHK